MSNLRLLSNGSFLGAVTLKSTTTAAIYTAACRFLNEHDWKDPVLLKAFLGSFTSATIAELLMTSIIQTITDLLNKNGNAGMKRIFDQGLNASISGGLNIKFYEMLIKNAPNIEGKKWMNHEEFYAQAIADVVGEVLSSYYLVPLFGLNQSHISSIYG